MEVDGHNAFDVVRLFEQRMCEYTGAPYAVAVDTGTAALFLALRYSRLQRMEADAVAAVRDFTRGNDLSGDYRVPVAGIPGRTFISVPMMAIHAGYQLHWTHQLWQHNGYYRISGTPVWDSALRLYPQLFRDLARLTVRDRGDPRTFTFVCLSFQYRKHLPIGRGGMILHDDPQADSWFRQARFFGRHEVPMDQEPGPAMLGWHMYMEPDRAARGLSLLMHMPVENTALRIDYPDLQEYDVFKPYLAKD